MKELILKNNKLEFTTFLKVTDDDGVISSTIIFDEPIELSTIFPGRGVLFGMVKQPQQPDALASQRSPIQMSRHDQKNLPNWLVKDLRRKNGRDS